MTDTYTATWADLLAYLAANGKLVRVRGDHPVFGDSEWIASTRGLHRYRDDAETAMWCPEGADVLKTPIPIPGGTTDPEHQHHYRPLATRLSGGRIGYEYFATAEPKYGFRCACGDVQILTLRSAVDHGWIEVLDRAEEPTA